MDGRYKALGLPASAARRQSLLTLVHHKGDAVEQSLMRKHRVGLFAVGLMLVAVIPMLGERWHVSGPFARADVSVKLQPRASRNAVGEPLGDELKIQVIAPPVDSAANQALIELLAGKLGCPRGQVELVRGRTSRHKTVRLNGFTAEQVLQKITG